MNDEDRWNTEPLLARSSLQRTSTIKKIRKLIKRYFGIKDRPKDTPVYSSKRSLLEEPSTSHSSSSSGRNRSRSRSLSSHPDKRTRPDCPSSRRASDKVGSQSFSRSYSHKSLTEGLGNSRNDKSTASPAVQNKQLNSRCHYAYQEDSDSGLESAPEFRSYPELSTPCVKGINNLGNTCYMNSVLQCLSTVDSLAEYFVLGHFASDLNNQGYGSVFRKLNGTNGAITRAFASVMRSLWHNECSSAVIQSFRSTLGRYNAAYRSFIQQDAQELLVWLLDKIHEDLSYSEKPGWSQEVGFFENYNVFELKFLQGSCCCPVKRCNNRSIISDLFEAEFRSSIRCRSCTFTKLNYDPFMCVSLQLPYDTRRPFYVTLVYFVGEKRRIIRYGLNVECRGRVHDIKECISTEARIPESRLLIFMLDVNGFVPLLSNRIYVSELPSSELSAVEIPSLRNFHREDVFLIFVIVEVSTKMNHYGGVRLTEPFFCTVPKKASYHAVCSALCGTIIDVSKEYDEVDGELFGIFRSGIHQIRVVGKDGNLLTMYPTSSMPLCTDEIQRKKFQGPMLHTHYSFLSTTQKTSGLQLPILPLILEFKEAFVQRNLKPLLKACEHIYNHHSCEVVEEQLQAAPASLEQCLNEFSSVEYIDWNCENCGMNGAEKTLMFRTLPQILVLHLKRFRQAEDRTMVKLDRAVHYPVEGMDLSSYVFREKPTSSMFPRSDEERSAEINGFDGDGEGLQKMEQDLLFVNTVINNDYLYDLIAIVHHMGETVNSGHYTATTRNAVDGKWRNYDDNNVRLVDPVDAADFNTAYLLFYERRSRRPHVMQTTSGHSSAESGIQEHWFSRTPSEGQRLGIDPNSLSATLPRAPLQQNNNFSRHTIPGTASSSVRRSYIRPVVHENSYASVRSKESHSSSLRRKVTNTEVW